eukprot:TRINITY_DN22767_c0_g1_i1.p1 TRINITY_DN22767_c0_g1~~TRINITY_DN22767_c0_g1_i1.p1  ORF type:complete len:431 (-),score=52.37 TRINITY_DN22767_c0_g1_i1:140-1432(-)
MHVPGGCGRIAMVVAFVDSFSAQPVDQPLAELKVAHMTFGLDEGKNAQLLHETVQGVFYAHILTPMAEWLPIWTEFHRLLKELATVAMEKMPSLLFAVGIEFYHWHWFHFGDDSRPRMNIHDVSLGAELLYRSLHASPHNVCAKVGPDVMQFLQVGCDYKWTHLIMMEAEVGREQARQLDLVSAGDMLAKANVHFAEMVRFPFFASRGWKHPLDMNFNSERFPSPGPVWDKELVPFAAWLKQTMPVFVADMDRIRNEPGLFKLLQNIERNAEGNDHWRLDDWELIELADTREEEPFKRSCEFANATCAALLSRPEVGGCGHAWAGFARMRPGGWIKAHMGIAPRLVVHIGLDVPEEQPIYLYVGNATLQWKTGETHVIDDTYVHSVRHDGYGGRERYILHVLICHPCEDSQRHVYARPDGTMPAGISCGA